MKYMRQLWHLHDFHLRREALAGTKRIAVLLCTVRNLAIKAHASQHTEQLGSPRCISLTPADTLHVPNRRKGLGSKNIKRWVYQVTRCKMQRGSTWAGTGLQCSSTVRIDWQSAELRIQKMGYKENQSRSGEKNILYLFCIYKTEGRKRNVCIPLTSKLMLGFLIPSIFYRTQTIKLKRIILYIA